ncbi:SDR family NAD(P)-dependent oxidoreductase [Pollutibacter soli]|uniref:SDR family NAD(P)-dependent oxidoreductase n=1 Tax=Pollutibacter soli TaxID=3034157 RepID=UPI0030137779
MNRNIWITGGSGNMGKAVIEKFLESGDMVTATLAPGEKKPELKGAVNWLEVDLSDEAKVEEILNTAYGKQGTVDAAILTVGGFAAGNLQKTTAADIQKMVELNFITAFNTVKPVFLKMKEKGEGRIFLIGARPAINMSDSTGILAYGISKSMIFRLAEFLNAEAKGTKVVVHVIVPSTIDTPQNRKSMPDVNPEKWVKASQIADIIHFYCSSAADPIREPVIKIYNQA